MRHVAPGLGGLALWSGCAQKAVKATSPSWRDTGAVVRESQIPAGPGADAVNVRIVAANEPPAINSRIPR
jgi:hypothetical protein